MLTSLCVEVRIRALNVVCASSPNISSEGLPFWKSLGWVLLSAPAGDLPRPAGRIQHYCRHSTVRPGTSPAPSCGILSSNVMVSQVPLALGNSWPQVYGQRCDVLGLAAAYLGLSMVGLECVCTNGEGRWRSGLADVRIVWVCLEHLAESPVRKSLNVHH